MTPEFIIVVALLIIISSLVYLWPWDEDGEHDPDTCGCAHFQVSDTMTLCGLDIEDYDGLSIGYLDDTRYPVTCPDCVWTLKAIAHEVREAQQ